MYVLEDDLRLTSCNFSWCSFPWSLTVDTAFGDTEDDGSGCGYSSTATLCEALGIPSPTTPNSPISPKSIRASAPSCTGDEQPQHTSKGALAQSFVFRRGDVEVKSIVGDSTKPTKWLLPRVSCLICSWYWIRPLASVMSITPISEPKVAYTTLLGADQEMQAGRDT